MPVILTGHLFSWVVESADETHPRHKALGSRDNLPGSRTRPTQVPLKDHGHDDAPQQSKGSRDEDV